jgi:hypothetical protein
MWTVLLRLGLLILMKPHARGDAADFQTIAHNLASGHGFSRCPIAPFPPTSQRPPLFPLLLSLLYTIEISDIYGPALLNLAFDLFSMNMSENFAKAAKLPRPRAFPWIIALCPMLITMGNYPLTESLSVMLFFLAALLIFEGKIGQSGLTFGLLSLCRSYYLIFPCLMAIFRPIKRISRKAWVLAAILSFAAPSVWVTRNLVTLKRPLFSQTGTAGAQAYVGVCRRGFDWWDSEDVRHITETRPFSEMVSAQCMPDDQLLELNSQAWNMVASCVQNNPMGTAINVLVKTWSLFFEWGQIFPYDYVPKGPRTLIDLIVTLIWARMIWIWMSVFRKNPSVLKSGPIGETFQYTLLNIGYVFVITLPFGIDARYLLAPAMLAFGVTLQMLASPADFVRDPLIRVFGESED